MEMFTGVVILTIPESRGRGTGTRISGMVLAIPESRGRGTGDTGKSRAWYWRYRKVSGVVLATPESQWRGSGNTGKSVAWYWQYQRIKVVVLAIPEDQGRGTGNTEKSGAWYWQCQKVSGVVLAIPGSTASKVTAMGNVASSRSNTSRQRRSTFPWRLTNKSLTVCSWVVFSKYGLHDTRPGITTSNHDFLLLPSKQTNKQTNTQQQQN